MAEREFEEAQQPMKKQSPSKNLLAEELCGMRPAGNALFQPHELGYACPTCGVSSYPELRWSEYAMFLWCSKCNVDIPLEPPRCRGRGDSAICCGEESYPAFLHP